VLFFALCSMMFRWIITEKGWRLALVTEPFRFSKLLAKVPTRKLLHSKGKVIINYLSQNYDDLVVPELRRMPFELDMQARIDRLAAVMLHVCFLHDNTMLMHFFRNFSFFHARVAHC
jgi:hypothetical protein